MTTPNPTPAPDMAVEAVADQLMSEIINFVQACQKDPLAQCGVKYKQLQGSLRAALARPQEVAEKERAALATAVRDQLHLVFLSGGDEHDAEAFRIQVRSLLAASRTPVAVGKFGGALAMRVLQSELYKQLDGQERAECDELIARWLDQPHSAGAGGSVGPWLSEQDATLLVQANELLLDYAEILKKNGHDSGAAGAECSADAVMRLGGKASYHPLQAQDAAPVEPAAFVVRDVDTGMLRDFTNYHSADQFLTTYSSRMLKPQFLFCYEAPQAKPEVTAGVQGDAARERPGIYNGEPTQDAPFRVAQSTKGA